MQLKLKVAFLAVLSFGLAPYGLGRMESLETRDDDLEALLLAARDVYADLTSELERRDLDEEGSDFSARDMLLDVLQPLQKRRDPSIWFLGPGEECVPVLNVLGIPIGGYCLRLGQTYSTMAACQQSLPEKDRGRPALMNCANVPDNKVEPWRCPKPECAKTYKTQRECARHHFPGIEGK